MSTRKVASYVKPGSYSFSPAEIKLLGKALETELSRLKRAAGNVNFPESAREGFAQEFSQVNALAARLGGVPAQ